MATGLQLIIFVTLACMISNTGAQQLIGKYLENLKKNMAILNSEKKPEDKYEYDYDEEDYFYEDNEENVPAPAAPATTIKPAPATTIKTIKPAPATPIKTVKPAPPPPPPKSSGRSKASPKGNNEYSAGSSKKYAAPKKEESSMRPSDNGVGFRFADDPPAPETVHVLTVKKFLFQAQPVTPFGKKTPDTTKIYYYV